MKKFLTIVIAVMTLTASTSQLKANDNRVIQLNQLPTVAQEFIKQNFTNSKISVIKDDYSIMGRTYKVIFSNGQSVEFDKQGSWEELDYNKEPIPYALIPTKINEYIKDNYSSQRALKIERDRNEYEVKLQNGIELKFDGLFNIKKIDN